MSNVIGGMFTLKTYMKNKSKATGETQNDDTTNARNTLRFPDIDKVISEEDYDTTLEMIDIYLDEDSALYDIEAGLRLIQKLEDVEDNIYLSSASSNEYYDSEEGMRLVGLIKKVNKMYNNDGNETGDLDDK